jgi:DNA-binding MarR family transcriptional regulator
MTARDRQRRIAAVRRFNRFYTRQLGVLRRTYLDSDYSLGEARVLYEIANGGTPTASDIGRALDLDAGYLSRTLRNFEKRGLIERKASASDARQSHLRLSPRGRKSFAPLEQRSQHHAAAMLGRLAPAEQARLVAAMSTIETVLAGPARNDPLPPHPRYILRAPKPGAFGWIVKRHAELYGEEYGWTDPFEGLCARIVADFVDNYDAKRERCWIAEMSGENVGSIHAGEGFKESRPHPHAAGGPESAWAWTWRPPHRRMHPLRAPRRLQEDHALDPPRAHRRAAHLPESRI